MSSRSRSTTDRDRSRALSAAALCLDYPDGRLLDQLGLLTEAAAALPAAVGTPLQNFLRHLATTAPGRLATDYVETFDLRRRCCLYLTYYAHGDTRKRGMALLRFTSAYRAAGISLASGELPDHLGVVCAVAARAPQVGLPLLADHRAGIELLRIALAEAGSRYLDVLDAIRAALPDPAPADLDLALQLARSGPPEEEVGLEPFAPPEYLGGRR
jgi:nitrate reductase delta subunit